MPEHSGVVSLLGDGHGNEGLGTMHDALRPPERSGALRLIDITPFVDPDVADPAARSQVSAEVDDAARTAGFMQVVGHGVARPVVDDLLAAMEAFFALEPDVKAAYRCPPGINRGYTPPRSEALANSLGLAGAADLFEAFNVGSAASWFPGRDLPPETYPENTYPTEVEDFERATMSWFGSAARVARTMDRIFGLTLGIGPDAFDALTSYSIDTLRMNNYSLPDPDVELEPDQLGMGSHTDYGIVTVLWAEDVPGLEILDPAGHWRPVQPVRGALLVNLGDALARWTNDEWISTMHRVAPPRVDGRLVPRRSAAFFHDGNFDTVIECLGGRSDRSRYEPVTVSEHLAAKLAGSRGGVLNSAAGREAARLAASES